MTKKSKEAIGIDIGGLRIKYVRLRDGKFEGFNVIDLQELDRSVDGILSRLETLINSEDSDIPVGIGVPGIVRTSDRVVVKSPNFPSWDHLNLAKELEVRIGRRVAIDNDANAFLRAECVLGAGRDHKDVLGLTLGTGLGGGVWFDGKIYRGARGMAGELGHVSFLPEGVPCGCGSVGCIEQYASTQFLARRCLETGYANTRGMPMVRVGRILAEDARAGNEQAQQLYQEMGYNLGVSVAGMVNLMDPSLVITGGGLSAAYDIFGEVFEKTVCSKVYEATAQELSFKVATLGKQAGAVGAALLALSDYDNLIT